MFAQLSPLARSMPAMHRAATSQNFPHLPRVLLLRPRFPRRVRRIQDSPAPKRHPPRFPQAKTAPVFPSPRPCVPPFCVPPREFLSAVPSRSRESPAQVLRRSSRSKFLAPASAPRRKLKAASQKNVFPATRQTRTAPAHLRARACESGG